MQSVLKHSCQSNSRGRGLRPCDVTLRSARFEKEENIKRDLYHHRVYTHVNTHLSSNNLVHVALYDFFKAVHAYIISIHSDCVVYAD